MFNDDFEKNKQKIKKRVRLIFGSVLFLIVLILGVQAYFVYFVVKEIDNNGGVRETIVDVLREVNKIKKEAEIEKE